MGFNEKMEISSIPAISAIYLALLQCGYDYYSFERSAEHVNAIKIFRETDTALGFFLKPSKIHAMCIHIGREPQCWNRLLSIFARI